MSVKLRFQVSDLKDRFVSLDTGIVWFRTRIISLREVRRIFAGDIMTVTRRTVLLLLIYLRRTEGGGLCS